MAVCESMVPMILASVDGTLDVSGEARLAAHVAGCPACRRALEEQKAVKQLLATLPAVEVSADFAARVRQRIARSVGWWEFADWRIWTLRLAPVAALLALLAWVPFGGDTTTSTPSATPSATPAATLASVMEAWATGGTSTGATSTTDASLHSLLNPEIDDRTLLADTFDARSGGRSQ